MGAFANRRGHGRLIGAALVLACALLVGVSASRSGVLAWSWSPWRRATLVRVEGPVEALTADSVTIAGRELVLRDDLASARDSLAVGDWVLAYAERDASGRLVARSLVLSRAPAAGSPSPTRAPAAPVEFEGSIEALPLRDDAQGLWVVGGVPLWVEAKTIIHGQPSLGADVEVRAEKRGTAAVAAELWVLTAEEHLVVVEGRIGELARGTAASPGALTLRDDKGSPPYILVVDDRTFIDESRGRAEVDMWARVCAVPQDDGTLWVQYLRILRP